MTQYDNDCKAIVMEYLLHYCYKNTAKSFLSEINKLDICTKSIQMTEMVHSKGNKNKTTCMKERLIQPVENSATFEEKNIDWDQVDARRGRNNKKKHKLTERNLLYF